MRQHLLLAAGQHAGGRGAALPELREEREHLVDRPGRHAGSRRLHADAQVLVDRDVGEDLTLLGHVGDADAGNPEGALAGEIAAVEAHLPAGRRHQPHDGLQRGRAARAVAPEQADDLARRNASETPCRIWLLS